MADISQNAALVQFSANAVLERGFNLGFAGSAGNIVYKNASNQWVAFDSDAGSGAGANVSDVRGMLATGGNANQPAVVVLEDQWLNVGGTLTAGMALYGSRNAGAITHDVPASGNYPVVLGVPRSTTILNFKPLAGGLAV
jgi:hypothetical protein